MVFSAYADQDKVERKTYQGKSHYTKTYIAGDLSTWEGFTAADKLIVQNAAEQYALEKCYDAGHVDCYVRMSRISKCNYRSGGVNGKWHCEATAIAIGF